MSPGPCRLRFAWALFAGIGLIGCLSAFGPNLRARGVHAGLPSKTPVGGESCMNCHESEADALARMHTEGSGALDPSGPPLVADWMVSDRRLCSDCHRIRE